MKWLQEIIRVEWWRAHVLVAKEEIEVGVSFVIGFEIGSPGINSLKGGRRAW
jgi:hypothetical protein